MSRAQLIEYAFYITLVITTITIISFLVSVSNTNRKNTTYLIANTCMASVPAKDRSDSYISKCYSIAEKETGANVTRFGAAK